MTLATALSGTSQGMDAPLVHVEADVGADRPSFSVVGLLETVFRESQGPRARGTGQLRP